MYILYYGVCMYMYAHTTHNSRFPYALVCIFMSVLYALSVCRDHKGDHICCGVKEGHKHSCGCWEMNLGLSRGLNPMSLLFKICFCNLMQAFYSEFQ